MDVPSAVAIFGLALAKDGWYRRLRTSVDADLERLNSERIAKLYPLGERHLGIGDALALVAAVTTAVVLVIQHTDKSDPSPQPLPAGTTTTR